MKILTEKTLDAFFLGLGCWLDTIVKRSRSESIGVIEKRNPWREDVWRGKSFTVIHHTCIKTAPVMSRPDPKHTWRIGFDWMDGTFMFRYGLAPMGDASIKI